MSTHKVDIQFFHRLTTLSLLVHTYFWIVFHKRSSWTLQIILGLTWFVQAFFAASGHIVDPSILWQAQTTDFQDLNANLQQIFSLALGLPMCSFLMIANTELCSQHMQGVKAFRSVLFDSSTLPEGKSIVRFHLLERSSNQIHLFRYLKAAYGAFRIVVRKNRLRANFGSRLFLKFFFQVHEIEDTAFALQQFVDTTEDVPIVVFENDLDSLATSAALALPLQDIWEGLPSEVCALHRYKVHPVQEVPFIANLGSSAPQEKFDKQRMTWLPQMLERRKHMAFEQAAQISNDHSKCAQCRDPNVKCPVQNTCSA